MGRGKRQHRQQQTEDPRAVWMCDGKSAFPTRKIAREVRDRTQRGGTNQHKKRRGAALTIYRC